MRAGTLLVAVVLTGCIGVDEPVPSEAEGREFLRQVVDLASAGRFDALCDLGGGNCDRLLAEAGDDVPADPPTLVGTRVIEPRQEGAPRDSGGLVLELCGTKQGEPYYTEVLVFREAGELRAIEPVYWSGFTINSDGEVGGRQADVPAECGRAEN